MAEAKPQSLYDIILAATTKENNAVPENLSMFELQALIQTNCQAQTTNLMKLLLADENNFQVMYLFNI